MVAGCDNMCVQCGGKIEAGQKWVREKIYEPALAGREPRYHRYHAELFDGRELSCWEKHLLEGNSGRLAA
jgi:hypothetical protein